MYLLSTVAYRTKTLITIGLNLIWTLSLKPSFNTQTGLWRSENQMWLKCLQDLNYFPHWDARTHTYHIPHASLVKRFGIWPLNHPASAVCRSVETRTGHTWCEVSQSVPNGFQLACSCTQLTAQMDRCTNDCDSEGRGSLQSQANSLGLFSWLRSVDTLTVIWHIGDNICLSHRAFQQSIYMLL